MENLVAKHWHHLPEEEVVDLLDGNPEKGLDQLKVKHLQETFGPNALYWVLRLRCELLR